MAYEAQNFERLIGTPGFSEQLLKNHFTLYQGYVANTNKLGDLLLAMNRDGKSATPEYAELKRSFGWEFNGMRLHELYFGNMANGGKGIIQQALLYSFITNQFGSFNQWEADFKATGALRGIGWVVLYYDHTGKRLFNTWVNEHDVGHLSGCVPLLIMDVFEHAFMLDYGLKRVDYIAAFFKAIDWDAVAGRFEAARR